MPTRELSRSPGMLPLFARAGAALIPGASRLPLVGGWAGGGGGREIPDLTLVLGDVTVDRDRLAAYDRVCGFRLSDTLPPTYPHMLVFPLHLALMTDSSFPFPAIGLVHIANRITQHRPIGVGEALALKVWATPLEPHPRGQQFSLRSEVRVGDELVWEEESTNLRRGGGGSGRSGGLSAREGSPGSEASGRSSPGERLPGSEASGRSSRGERSPGSDELPVSAIWELSGDLGRRYGAVSGDLNPIHMHPLSARLFGFPSAIAHGMWTKARCLAALERHLAGPFTVEVAFRKPIVLPAKVEFAHSKLRFAVRDAAKGTPHLDGGLVYHGVTYVGPARSSAI